MKCIDCLIWQTRRKELTYLLTTPTLINALASSAPLIIDSWRKHELLRDTEHKNKCILVNNGGDS